MGKNLRKYFYHESIYIRFLSLFSTFILFFGGATILSYYFLPEGFLLSKNSILDWETSNSLLLSAMQILSFNLISVFIFVFANFFPFPSKEKALMPLGYWCLIISFILNGVTLGTWSFTAANTAAPDLINRLLRTFDVFHRAGLWEMTGQMMIASATGRIAIKTKNDGDIFIKHFRESRLNKLEVICIIVGLLFMLTGAFIESNAILC